MSQTVFATVTPAAEDSVSNDLPGLAELWAETRGDPEICIAVLDGPVDQSHPSLATANLTRLQTLIPDIADRGLATQHGTHVASILFGQHGSPVKGVAPLCRGLIVPIFGNAPDGSIAPCSQLDLARAITQAAQAGAQIINISGGGPSLSGEAEPLLIDAVRNCANNNVLIVAAAGNQGCECLQVPGALPSVLAVGAMNAHSLPLDFSNWGDRYRVQGVLAPGENILGAVPGGSTAIQSGTSYATPIVAGVAALLLSLQQKLDLQPNPLEVRAVILESAYSCDPIAVQDCRPFMVGSLNISAAHARITRDYQSKSASRSSDHPHQIEASANDADIVPATEQSSPKVGDMAPDFMVKDQTGQDVRLNDYQGKAVILWFYPHADTPG